MKYDLNKTFQTGNWTKSNRLPSKMCLVTNHRQNSMKSDMTPKKYYHCIMKLVQSWCKTIKLEHELNRN